MKIFDCAIIGAGAAGLSASLVLGRSRKKIAVFDNGTNRNRVTRKSHGFLTRDGATPQRFKELGINEMKNYPSVHYYETTIKTVTKRDDGLFFIQEKQKEYVAERIVLATGVQEVFPDIPNLREYYGKSLFSCPYCDGWEIQGQPLIIIAEKEEQVINLTKLLYNWSTNLVIATNGYELSASTITELNQRNISIIIEPITALHGEDGYLQKVQCASSYEIERKVGFVAPTFIRSNSFAENLGCQLETNGAMKVDNGGRTSVKNVYAIGEAAKLGASSLMIAAGEGYKVAMTVNADITLERF
ncbi:MULTISPECIES: NAD(P)/FAD-dependent oxidoreductase [Bacillus cereus group]|uniref:NAD(P)/FAD-dependent oxidoreductase n=1 Tax=Bacillus cereus TaxID=1396 RepID=A0A9W7UWJ8_BACCE|nr:MULTISPECIES: NAD(P)/FAD-dependent oxidoreductase [Bacillus cereus group]KAB2393492.1 NAD(P)/FAD-dependent oxidoreductase [Bacillus cereus]KAB2405667.1 NAD(P)/FAD-dependent oxidoreductase [Bacillus cereus]KAB2428563.1 NAD(P)/FAD-dependent oxidoreductase [Bacillus cereus]MBU4642731.1 NAD(P)/FAD-dependent oxidoreductase [Bacillus toyonensis]